MVALEDFGHRVIASAALVYLTWAHSAPIANVRAAVCSVVETTVECWLTTGKKERWPSGWRAVASLYRRMIVYAEQDGVLFMQVTHQ